VLTFDEAIARLPGGRFECERYRACCPAHRGSDRNLSVWADENGIACFKCWSHGCSTKEVVAALRVAPASCVSAAPRAKMNTAREKDTCALAVTLWREACEARGTIVQDYLFGRGFTGEAPRKRRVSNQVATSLDYHVGLAIPASLRFHPRLKHRSGVYLPAMVAAIEYLDGAIVGVHRTFLKPDGTGKADVEPQKMALGRVTGCAVHLTAGAPELVTCEGIETGLAILQATGMHVWCALGTSNLGRVELPGFVREVIVAADHDDAGIEAARDAAKLYRANGYQVRIVSPADGGADFNNMVEVECTSGRPA
jgi:putative DNA primase/helicase